MNDIDIDALVASDPERYQVTSNGTVKDLANGGRFIACDPSRNPYAINKDNAHEMHKLRRERTIESALRGIARGAKVDDPFLGVELMTGSITEMVMDKKGKVAEQFRAVLLAAGLIDEGRNGNNSDGSPTQNVYNIGTDALQQVIEAIQQAKKQRQDDDNGVIDV
jgi:hypothetical protein